MTPTDTTSGERYAAFRHGAFLRFWVARFLATFSTQIVSVAVGWQIYDLTRDPFDLGLVGIIQFLPSLLLVLVTGVIADRFGRRLIMGLSALLEAACAAAILLFTWHGLASPLPIFGVLLVFGIARLLRAGFRLAGRQSGAAGRFRQCDRLEFIGLANGNHRRAGRRRLALRHKRRSRLWHGDLVHAGLGAADLLDSQTRATHRNRQADTRHALRRFSLHLEREGRPRGNFA
jgi:hypothetical protein